MLCEQISFTKHTLADRKEVSYHKQSNSCVDHVFTVPKKWLCVKTSLDNAHMYLHVVTCVLQQCLH